MIRQIAVKIILKVSPVIAIPRLPCGLLSDMPEKTMPRIPTIMAAINNSPTHITFCTIALLSGYGDAASPITEIVKAKTITKHTMDAIAKPSPIFANFSYFSFPFDEGAATITVVFVWVTEGVGLVT